LTISRVRTVLPLLAGGAAEEDDEEEDAGGGLATRAWAVGVASLVTVTVEVTVVLTVTVVVDSPATFAGATLAGA
jgi:hypothetical protein